MGLLSYFKKEKKVKSADLARERLQILVSHERRGNNHPDYVLKLKKEILEVLKKYMDIDDDLIEINHENEDGNEYLELNISLPDNNKLKST